MHVHVLLLQGMPRQGRRVLPALPSDVLAIIMEDVGHAHLIAQLHVVNKEYKLAAQSLWERATLDVYLCNPAHALPRYTRRLRLTGHTLRSLLSRRGGTQCHTSFMDCAQHLGTHLYAINLSFCDVMPSHLRSIGKAFPSLRELDISHNYTLGSGRVLHMHLVDGMKSFPITAFTTLRVLKASGNLCGNPIANNVSHLVNLTQLQLADTRLGK